MQEFDNRGQENEAEARAELEAALRVLKEGEVVTGTVVRVQDDSLMVDVGYKSEGIITLNELSHRSLSGAAETGLKVGDQIRVMVMTVDSHGEGVLRLSIRRAEEAVAWDRVVKAKDAGEVLEAKVTEAVKGGLVVDLGLRAFLPASQVERGYVNDLAKYVGQTIRVKVIEMEKGKNRVILSRRQVLESERDNSKKGFWSAVEEGQVREGTVKSITDFGAFIDLGGVDGLLHISEMSYGRIKHPSQVLKDGEKIQVKVLRLDREKEKVSLGLKQVLADPWTSVTERYPEGTIVTGTVARLATFGAFVELEPGVDGLIHISQLADHRVNTPGDVVQVGQEVKAKVVGVSPEQRRISLSLRDVDEAPAAEEIKTEEVKTEEVKTEEVKTEEVKTEEVKAEEVKVEEVKVEETPTNA
ncbi:MAG TPA: 30S ribosomal protein S1 [Symbiobacteriaceae bacterium]